MTEEIVIEEKQPGNEVMSREELEIALGSPTLRKACLKSPDPKLHLEYLNTVMRWYELKLLCSSQLNTFISRNLKT